MRAIILVIAATILGACTTTPVNTAANLDHKYNMISQTKPAESDFVGTSAVEKASKPQPSWYKFGHP